MSIKSERQSNFFNVCKKCMDNCCQNAQPPISSKRRRIIETFLKSNSITIGNPFLEASYVFPREDIEGYCVFCNKATMKCLVHPVKPETCVAGPITFGINVSNGKIEWFLKKEKICKLAGTLCKDEVRFKKHTESAKKEILNLVHELDAEALKAILKIDEPETSKIDEDAIEREVVDKINAGAKQKA